MIHEHFSYQPSGLKYNKQLDSNFDDWLLSKHISSPFSLTSGCTDKKAQKFHPLVLVGTSNHVSSGSCEETLTSTPNHHKTPSQLPSLDTNWHCLCMCFVCEPSLNFPPPPRKPHYISNKAFHFILVHEWCHQSEYLDQILGQVAHLPSVQWLQ